MAGREIAHVDRLLLGDRHGQDDVEHLDDFIEAGADHVILMTGPPFALGPLEQLLAAAE